MKELIEKFDISPNDSNLYTKALKIIDFMKNKYNGEDLRFVSAYLFNDSKIIDKNSKLRKLFNHFSQVERPNIIYIRTDTDLFINGINIKTLTEQLHLCAFFGGDIKSIKQESCKVVISENLSFFMSAQPNNAIFLYSKGFHLISSLSAFIKKLNDDEIIHFGDVDFEGLAIFEAFKKNIDSITFYPDIEIVKNILAKYRNSLPKHNQTLDKYAYRHTNKFIDLIKDSTAIEQEFIHSLFYKDLLRKPSWIK
jgi:5S rRNA maturation endonuclease (ribonuclease M5)